MLAPHLHRDDPAESTDPGDGQCADCEGCRQLAWCPVWDLLLCPDCRNKRTDAELRATGPGSKASALAEALGALPGRY